MFFSQKIKMKIRIEAAFFSFHFRMGSVQVFQSSDEVKVKDGDVFV